MKDMRMGEDESTVSITGLVPKKWATVVTVNLPASVLIQTSTNGIELIWPTGTLQSATNIFGPWNDLGGVTSPYVVTPTGSQQFYRIKFQ
jgi:hypothetical protein